MEDNLYNRSLIENDYVNNILNLKYGMEYLHAYSVGRSRFYIFLKIITSILGSGAVIGAIYLLVSNKEFQTFLLCSAAFIGAIITALHLFLPWNDHISKIKIINELYISLLNEEFKEYKKLKNVDIDKLEKKCDTLSSNLADKVIIIDKHWHGIKVNKNIKRYKNKAEIETRNYQNFNFPNFMSQP